MLSTTPTSTRRRGIILLMVLATLALMALIGVTFAALAGQGRINARNFAQSVLTPGADELMDFALQQLIVDTGDVRSALRGHSLGRDMYGNDARNNGYLAAHPSTGAPFTITDLQPVANSAGLYDFKTSIPIPAASPTLYGYNFTRWILRLSYTGNTVPRPVDQTFEILYDNDQNGGTSTALGGSGFHVFRVTPIDAATALNNSTAAAQNGLGQWQDFLVQPQPGCRSVHPRWSPAPRLQRPRHGAQRRLRQLPLQRRPARRECESDPARRPRRRGDGRGLRCLRPRELVPGDPERRRPGDRPVVPPAGDHPPRSQERRQRLGPQERDLVLGQLRGADPPAGRGRRP